MQEFRPAYLFNRAPYREAGSIKFNDQRITPMAKGQMRGNREMRKPKQEKAPTKVEASFANQIKDASKSSPQGGRYKK